MKDGKVHLKSKEELVSKGYLNAEIFKYFKKLQ
jgi:hypothetical protein